jgi:GR25 family glycosyltransferase involved in LPS biosynthesis
MVLYNTFLKIYKNTNYPFNLTDNLKDNIINTRNEIELEYSKDLNVFVDKNIKPTDKKIGKNENSSDFPLKKIYIYEYYF